MRPSEPRDGEIFLPDEKVRVFLFPHAFGSQREAFDVPAGLSVTEAIRLAKGHAPVFPAKFGFYLQDGTRIPEHMWDHVRLKPNTSVVARPVAEGPFMALIPLLSSAFAGFQAAIAALGIFGKLIMLGISIGLQFLLNKLFAPKPPDPSDAKPVYSISASRNQVAQWQPIPLLLGRMRITPPLAASPYTEIVGDDQYLRQLFCNGYGPLALEIDTAKIGETLVSSYPEAEIQHRYGDYVGEPATTLYPASVIDNPLSIELKKVDPPSKQACATDGYQVALDFMWPNGLCWIDEKGKRQRMGYSISIRYREYPSGVTWTSAPNFWMVLATQKATRRTVTINLPVVGRQYEFEIHKEGNEMSQAQIDRSKIGVFDTCMWTAIRTFRTGEPVRFTDAPVSLTALRVKASGRINQSVDTYNILATSKVTAWNGTAWVANTASRSPPDLFRWVLQCGANRRPFPTAKIDLVALQQWSAYCKTKGFVYDKWVVGQMSVFDLLTEICAAGRAMPVFKDGKWSVVWDDQNVPVAQLFTPRNSWNFEEQRDLEPIPHGYRIRFPNEQKEWKEDERVVYNDGYNKANATLLEGFDTPGQTHTDRVWRHARFHLAQRILRPGIYSIMTSWDALPLIRGDRVRVNFDSFKYGLYAGRVVSVDGPNQIVTVDTNLTLAGTTGYMFRFRLANGTYLERSVDPTLYQGEYTTVQLVGTGLPMPAANDLFSFGYSGTDSRVFRVTGIEPMEDMVHRLTLVADAPEIANADIGQIPAYTEGISDPIDPFLMPPKNLQVTDGVYSEGGVQYWAVLYISWDAPPFGRTAQFQLQYREENDDTDKWVSLPSQAATVNNTEIRQLEAGVYTVRIRSVFENGSYSNWLYAPAHATTEFSQPPADVENFRISTTGDVSILRWDAVAGVDVSYELRHAADGIVAPIWNGALPLIDTVTTSAQIGTRTGTFFIKAKRPWGLASANAKTIYTNVASLTALNFITVIQEDPNFTGVKLNTEMVAEELRLTDDVTGLNFQIDGTYTFANQINLGENIAARITLFIDAYGYNPQNVMSKWVTLASVNPIDPIDKSEWSIQPEYRITQVNPTSNLWEAWRPFGGLTDIVAWGIQFRLVLKGKVEMDVESNTVYSTTTPAIQQLSVTIDMADRIEQGDDIIAPAPGITITYPNGKYRVPPAVVITPQNMVQGDYWIVSAKTETSFNVKFYTSGNVLKSLTFDWMSKGWGRVQ